MDLTEVKGHATRAMDLTNQAMGLVTDVITESLHAAFDGMKSVEDLGPIAVQGSGQPYDYTEARNRLAAASDFLHVTQAALETAAEYAHAASNLITDARDELSPALPEGFPRLTSAHTALGEADKLLSDLFEIDGPILPITATTTTFRLGQAISNLTDLIGMLS